MVRDNDISDIYMSCSQVQSKVHDYISSCLRNRRMWKDKRREINELIGEEVG